MVDYLKVRFGLKIMSTIKGSKVSYQRFEYNAESIILNEYKKVKYLI